MADPTQALKLGPITHVAVAVRNVDDGISRLVSLGLSVGPVWDLEVSGKYRGNGARAGVKAVFAASTPIPIELVEPTGGDSSIAAFLAAHGEGVQHFGYSVDNVAKTVEDAAALGIAVDWLISDEHGAAIAFLSPEALFGVYAEVVRGNPPINLLNWRRS
jgi:hypothetical protein